MMFWLMLSIGMALSWFLFECLHRTRPADDDKSVALRHEYRRSFGRQ